MIARPYCGSRSPRSASTTRPSRVAGSAGRSDPIEEGIAPVLSPKKVGTKYLTVKRNDVAGVRQVARGWHGKKEVLRLELQMYVGAEQPRDEIEIAGVPPLKVTVAGGTPGDLATPAILVNMVPALLAAGPGLHTMATLPLPRIAV